MIIFISILTFVLGGQKIMSLKAGTNFEIVVYSTFRVNLALPYATCFFISVEIKC